MKTKKNLATTKTSNSLEDYSGQVLSPKNPKHKAYLDKLLSEYVKDVNRSDAEANGGANYVNPPYGRELPLWIKKGFEEWKKGKTVVFLIPSRTDTRWWHDYCMNATEIRFIKGRLKFDDQKNSAPFPSAIIIFKSK